MWISKLLNTTNETLILGGEGILGLEAACASLTEEGDRVLVIDNGIFGAGFADFVSMYGGTPVLFTQDYDQEIDITKLQELIDESNNIVFFGGAGVSTESGIPDFRSVDGLYNQKYDYPPETILSHSFYRRKGLYF